jgi:hypothetical protein
MASWITLWVALFERADWFWIAKQNSLNCFNCRFVSKEWAIPGNWCHHSPGYLLSQWGEVVDCFSPWAPEVVMDSRESFGHTTFLQTRFIPITRSRLTSFCGGISDRRRHPRCSKFFQVLQGSDTNITRQVGNSARVCLMMKLFALYSSWLQNDGLWEVGQDTRSTYQHGWEALLSVYLRRSPIRGASFICASRFYTHCFRIWTQRSRFSLEKYRGIGSSNCRREGYLAWVGVESDWVEHLVGFKWCDGPSETADVGFWSLRKLMRGSSRFVRGRDANLTCVVWGLISCMRRRNNRNFCWIWTKKGLTRVVWKLKLRGTELQWRKTRKTK